MRLPSEDRHPARIPRKAPMELDELRELIINTNDEYWNKLVVGPYYHDRIWHDGDDFDGTSHSHDSRAVLLNDANISIEWGLRHREDDDSDGYPWADFRDKRVESMLVDVFYAGALVDRSVLFRVDGGRSYLPDYDDVRVDDGEPHIIDDAVWEYQVDRWGYLLAQLINQLDSRDGYESYFARSGLVRV